MEQILPIFLTTLLLLDSLQAIDRTRETIESKCCKKIGPDFVSCNMVKDIRKVDFG